MTAHFDLSTTEEESVRTRATNRTPSVVLHPNDRFRQKFVSLVFVGAAIGSLSGAPAADLVGRRPAIAACSMVFTLSSVVMMLASSFGILLLGRFLVGVAIGASSTTVSVYIAELSKPGLRGVLVSINEVALCFGCLVAICTGLALEHAVGGWRYMLGIAAVPAMIQFVGLSRWGVCTWWKLRGLTSFMRCVRGVQAYWRYFLKVRGGCCHVRGLYRRSLSFAASTHPRVGVLSPWLAPCKRFVALLSAQSITSQVPLHSNIFRVTRIAASLCDVRLLSAPAAPGARVRIPPLT